jgi:hypothetical protein
LTDGLIQALSRLDWTWFSLLMYLALPFGWRGMGGESFTFSSIRLFELGLSILVWSVGLIAYFRSQTAWQKALGLQLGLMLAPGTADIISNISQIFWSERLMWIRSTPLPPLTTLGLYAAFGLPWLGLMFIPALFISPFQSVSKLLPAKDAKANRPGLCQTFSRHWHIGVLWFGATCLGLAGPLLLRDPGPLQILVAVFLLGILQEWVLRRIWRPKGWWVIATTAGLVGGWFLAIRYTLLDLYIAQYDCLDMLFGYSIMGASVGMFQGYVLKRWVRHAELWVLVNMSSWLTAWVISRLIIFSSAVRVEEWVEFLVFGLVVGAATGLLLIWLLRFPHPDPSHSEVTHASNHA